MAKQFEYNGIHFPTAKSLYEHLEVEIEYTNFIKIIRDFQNEGKLLYWNAGTSKYQLEMQELVGLIGERRSINCYVDRKKPKVKFGNMYFSTYSHLYNYLVDNYNVTESYELFVKRATQLKLRELPFDNHKYDIIVNRLVNMTIFGELNKFKPKDVFIIVYNKVGSVSKTYITPRELGVDLYGESVSENTVTGIQRLYNREKIGNIDLRSEDYDNLIAEFIDKI